MLPGIDIQAYEAMVAAGLRGSVAVYKAGHTGERRLNSLCNTGCRFTCKEDFLFLLSALCAHACYA